MAPPRNTRRRNALADAAIEVLGTAGIHKLSHRAVDERAGVPAGTAANYFPRREDLLAGASEKLVTEYCPNEFEEDWDLKGLVDAQMQYYPTRFSVDDLSQAATTEDLVESLTRLYCFLYGEPEAALRPAAVHRARAMGLSDQWVREGCQPDSRLLPLEHAALVRSYAAMLAAVHH